MGRTIRLRPWLMAAAAFLLFLPLMSCASQTRGAEADIRISKDAMLHAQQVLERYDADGDPVPQYLELWLTDEMGRCAELDAEGNEIAVALDTGSENLTYDAKTLEAQKPGKSMIFILRFGAMKKMYPRLQASNDGTYAGRDCTFYLMETDDGDDWVKLYVDKETGYVLLCDAETFRLRTALMEEVPENGDLFLVPSGLNFAGGEGK
jgi:hypothetical protein